MGGLASRLFALLACGGAAFLGAVSTSQAQQRVQGHLDSQFAPIFSGSLAKGDWLPARSSDLAAQICASNDDLAIAIAPRGLSEAERKICDKAGRKYVYEKLIGSIVVVPVSQPGAFSQITLRHVFEAVASEMASGQPNRVTTWRQVDPKLPDAPIKVLLPAAGSVEDALLSETLIRFCLAQRPTINGANAAERMGRCARLRNDAAVAYHVEGQSASAWLADAGGGGVALVGYGRLAADARLTGVLPLDGQLAQPDVRARGDYPVSQPIYFIASHNGRGKPDHSARVAALADAVFAEAVIGPEGRAALAGLAPLPAADRIALRKEFARFLGKGGLWSGLWD